MKPGHWKIHFIVLGRKHRSKEIGEAKLVLHCAEFQPEKTATHLGFTLDDKLKWQEHIQKLRGKCFSGLARLRRV